MNLAPLAIFSLLVIIVSFAVTSIDERKPDDR